MTKLKNSSSDKTKTLKLWQNSKLKLWQDSKPQIVTKLKNSNCNKTQKGVIVTSFSKTDWDLDNRWDVLGAAFYDSRKVFFTCDRWQMKGDRWHVTCDTWRVLGDEHCTVQNLLNREWLRYLGVFLAWINFHFNYVFIWSTI